jgi:hypothetical protein
MESGARFLPLAAAGEPAQFPPSLVRELLALFDKSRAPLVTEAIEKEVALRADAADAQFEPRSTFVAALRSGVITGSRTPVFTIGGQLGYRSWRNDSFLLGGQLEAENIIFSQTTRFMMGLMARADIAQWKALDARFFNLPAPALYLTTGPVLAFGEVPAFGFRAALGVSLGHLFSIVTPVMIEAGFQSLTIDGLNASGLRVVVGIGF